MSKTARLSERIAILEQELGKSGNQLGLDAGIGNGTVGGWTDNQVDKPTTAVEKFLRHYRIRIEWWKTLEGEVFITQEQKEPAVTENPASETSEEIYRNIVEGNTEYLLIPRSVLQEK